MIISLIIFYRATAPFFTNNGLCVNTNSLSSANFVGIVVGFLLLAEADPLKANWYNKTSS
jgi:hypothetical protein